MNPAGRSAPARWDFDRLSRLLPSAADNHPRGPPGRLARTRRKTVSASGIGPGGQPELSYLAAEACHPPHHCRPLPGAPGASLFEPR